MSQQIRYPASSASVTLSASGNTGSPVPAQALQVGGKDGSGDLRALSVTSAGVLNVAASSLPLPTGAATAANQTTEIAKLTSIDGKLPAALGQLAMAASLSIAIASDQSAIPVSAASLPLPSGAATSAKQDTGNTSLSSIDGKITACNTGAVVVSSSALPSGAATGAKQDTGNTSLGSIDTKTPALVSGRVPVDGSGVTQPISAAALPLPSGAATDTVATANGVLIGAVNETAPGTDTASSGLNGRLQRIAQRLTSLIALIPASLGQKTMANSFAVTIASDQSALSTSEAGATTGTTTSVASSGSTGTILASNASRKGATITNESTSVLYLKFGATASLTSYAVAIPSNGYYEVPFKYTGIIDGIWSSANGNARVTELT